MERGQWREAAALPDPAAGKFPYIEAMTLFARAVGAARSGDPGAAEKDVARLAAVADALKAANNDYWATEVEAQRRGAAAWIAFAGGKRDEALSLMRAAADLEDASEKSGISPVASCRRASFWATCSSKAAASTKRLPLTKRTLVNAPKRFRSFYGAAQAAAAAGNRDKARYYFGRVVEMTNSGSDRPALTKARAYLAAN